jgi:hypothetical protein
MSRRISSAAMDSLELLLDTICNTFGAVIFISMLVALLVNRSTSERDPRETTRDAVAESSFVQSEIETARQKLRVLSEQVAQQQLITEKFANKESLNLAGKLKRQTEQSVRLMEEKSDVVQEITTTKAESAQLQQRLDRQQAEYDTQEARNLQLRQKVSEELELSGRTARIPQVRKTTKMAVVYAIDDEHLHCVTRTDQTVDDTDCESSTSLGVVHVSPRAGAGVAVTGKTSSRSLHKKLQGIANSRFFVQLFVSRDSFAAFLPVKESLVKLGLEYEVIITESNEVELYLGASERDSFVQ